MFKQRKNKRFNYKPRFGKQASEPKSDDIREDWKAMSSLNRKKRKSGFSLIWLIIALALVLFLWYYFEMKS
ncbi:MAG: hypothetical protein HKO92_06775 [Flavobacteriaceae bacterium]|nr:hypothetical protein [Flavobacteriaceae bacterium]